MRHVTTCHSSCVFPALCLARGCCIKLLEFLDQHCCLSQNPKTANFHSRTHRIGASSASLSSLSASCHDFLQFCIIVLIWDSIWLASCERLWNFCENKHVLRKFSWSCVYVEFLCFLEFYLLNFLFVCRCQDHPCLFPICISLSFYRYLSYKAYNSSQQCQTLPFRILKEISPRPGVYRGLSS